MCRRERGCEERVSVCQKVRMCLCKSNGKSVLVCVCVIERKSVRVCVSVLERKIYRKIKEIVIVVTIFILCTS